MLDVGIVVALGGTLATVALHVAARTRKAAGRGYRGWLAAVMSASPALSLVGTAAAIQYLLDGESSFLVTLFLTAAPAVGLGFGGAWWIRASNGWERACSIALVISMAAAAVAVAILCFVRPSELFV